MPAPTEALGHVHSQDPILLLRLEHRRHGAADLTKLHQIVDVQSAVTQARIQDEDDVFGEEAAHGRVLSCRDESIVDLGKLNDVALAQELEHAEVREGGLDPKCRAESPGAEERDIAQLMARRKGRFEQPEEQELPGGDVVVGEVKRDWRSGVVGLELLNAGFVFLRGARQDSGLDAVAVVVVMADIEIDDVVRGFECPGDLTVVAYSSKRRLTYFAKWSMFSRSCGGGLFM